MSVESDTARYYADLDREDASESWREAHEQDAIDDLCCDLDVLGRYLEIGTLTATLLLNAVLAHHYSPEDAKACRAAFWKDVEIYITENEQDAITRRLDDMERGARDESVLSRAGY